MKLLNSKDKFYLILFDTFYLCFNFLILFGTFYLILYDEAIKSKRPVHFLAAPEITCTAQSLVSKKQTCLYATLPYQPSHISE